MIAYNELQILIDAGISDTDELLSAAAAFLRDHPLHIEGAVNNALSQQEEAFLKRGGAKGVKASHSQITAAAKKNTATVAGEYAQMVSTALGQKHLAARLGVSASRIRQRLDEGSLYALSTPAGRVCPLFQFDANSTLPGLKQVLGAIAEDAHPVAVQRFFLTENPDLISDLAADRAMSPREWLIQGHKVADVVLLAAEL